MNLINHNHQFLGITCAVLLCIFIFTACNDDNNIYIDATPESKVEVIAIHDHAENLHLFEMSAHEIPSGWTTFEFTNASPTDHFFVIYKVPEEAIVAAEAAGEPLLDHWFQGVTEPFQNEFNPYHRGEINYGEFVDNLVGSILEKGPWFLDPGAPPMGGPGFTAPGKISVNTLYLEPGDYVVECYVKDEDGQFHSYLGMIELMHVTEDSAGTTEPSSDSSVSISTAGGIQINGDLQTGKQVIKILFEDQDTYGHLLGHNVQLVRFDNEPDQQLLEELATWMDWTQPTGLVDRAPEGTEFIGGSMEMTGGAVTFLHAELEPGYYAWIAEVPDPAAHDMLKTFVVN